LGIFAILWRSLFFSTAGVVIIGLPGKKQSYGSNQGTNKTEK
jgi:hypothetical protein